jgi:class III poly(R)-hydroxyalkanoic acid synthase PhaE subunit
MLLPHEPDKVSQLLTDTQQHMMNNWMAMVQSASMRQNAPFNRQAFQSIVEIWRNTVQSGIRMMTLRADPAVRDVAEKIFTSQLNMLRFIELTSQIWSQVAIAIYKKQDWQMVLGQQIDQTRLEWQQLARRAINNSGNQQDLWQRFINEGCGLTVFWPEALRQIMLGSYQSQAPSPTGVDMASLHWEAYPTTIGQFLYAPGVEKLQHIHESLQNSFVAWLAMQQAMEAYHSILIDTWLSAYETLLRDLGLLAESGEAVESVRDLLNRWGATADVAFKKTFQKAEFVQAQAHIVNTVMTFRKNQQRVNEHVMELYGLPTRSEIDESHRRVYELRKEIKALRRELADLKKAKS